MKTQVFLAISHIFTVLSAEPDSNMFGLNLLRLNDITDYWWLSGLNYLFFFFKFLTLLEDYSISPPNISVGSITFIISKSQISIPSRNVETTAKLPLVVSI